MTVSTKIRIGILAKQLEPADLSTPEDSLELAIEKILGDGTGSDQADLLFHDRRTLADSASESLVLTGTLKDKFDQVLSFLSVKAFVLRNLSTTQSLTVGNGANPWASWLGSPTSTAVVPPGGLLFLVSTGAGFPVTPATGDVLKIANGALGTSTDFDLVLLGSSA
jgi:hypothetical protein